MSKERSQLLFLCAGLLLAVALACGQSAPSATAPGAAAPTATVPGAAAPSATVPIVTAPASQALEPGLTTRSLTHDGMQRTYLLYIPAGYNPDRPMPVVLIFHGFGLSGEEMIRITGFNAQADAAGFLAVYPNGSGSKPAWNGGDCCGQAAVKQVDDVGFVRALIEDLSTLVDIDRKRVYATGFSNGAIMAYRLACDLSDQIAAIAPVSAAQATQSCQPGRAVPIQHFHGTADRLNPYDGGHGPGGGLEFASVADTIQFWVTQNGCPAQAQTSESGSIVHELYAPCDQGAAVELYTIAGGEHAWPGGESVSAEIGAPTMEISATLLMWEFFSAHPMP
ncbi:MAG: hypothetical protein JXA78_12725 [Anaerolineales bacterium]|nr:hypothetical protein [Anaerolineales bacterium]